METAAGARVAQTDPNDGHRALADVVGGLDGLVTSSRPTLDPRAGDLSGTQRNDNDSTSNPDGGTNAAVKLEGSVWADGGHKLGHGI